MRHVLRQDLLRRSRIAIYANPYISLQPYGFISFTPETVPLRNICRPTRCDPLGGIHASPQFAYELLLVRLF